MRLDVYLFEYGYVQSRQRAKTLIEAGGVCIDGVDLKKPSYQIDENAVHAVKITDTLAYVGRGGQKLEAALDAFGVDPRGMTAVDIGASTGGFTDCLLQRGAVRVFAVDSGENQLAPKLAGDRRVVSIEHLNARTLAPAHLGGERIDLAVMDVSFISATYILPQIPALFAGRGELVCLIKPQFEVGRSMLGKGGIVKSREAHEAAVLRVVDCACQLGFSLRGLIDSPIKGGDGNREFLAHFSYGTEDAGWTRQDVRTFMRKN